MRATAFTAQHFNNSLPVQRQMFDLVLFESVANIEPLIVFASDAAYTTNGLKTLAQVQALTGYLGMWRGLRLTTKVDANDKDFVTIDDINSAVTTLLPVKTASAGAWALRLSTAATQTTIATVPTDTTALPFLLGGEVGSGHALTLIGGNSLTKDKKVRIDKFGFRIEGEI